MASLSEFRCPCSHAVGLIDVGPSDGLIPYYLLFVGNCGHGFHQSCAEHMIGRRPSCPTCGQNIVDSVSRTLDNAGNPCVRDRLPRISFKITGKVFNAFPRTQPDEVREFESLGLLFVCGMGAQKYSGILLDTPICLGNWYGMGNTLPRRLYLLSPDRKKIQMNTFVPACGRIPYYESPRIKFTITFLEY